jgi:site-specific DNA-adenine methylase
MFYYYGAKNNLAKHYKEPRYNLIIEPFAGSAAYSCFHLFRNPKLKAELRDKNEDVAATWDFLLKCSERDIVEYKTPELGEYAYDFLIKTCTVSNASSRCNKMKYTERLDRVFQIQKRRLIKLLPIRDRISFKQGEYRDIKNKEATWFIDPPYQIKDKNGSIFQNGDGYGEQCGTGQINFKELSDFCLGRSGQIIV